ncbi:MAG: TolC family protein [Sphingobacteriales bacterium]|nr:TolC family protein [Sphingobacteriales bacterium]
MRSFLLVCLTILGSFVRAQEAPSGKTFQFNLQQCLEYAYANNDSLKNAKLDIESANYKVKETVGLGLPQISGSAQFQDFLKVPTTLLPGEFFNQPGTFIPVKFGVKYQSNAGISVNQLVFNGTYLVGLQASKTFKELSQKSFVRTKIQTEINVTKAYYQVLVNGEQLRLLDANLSQLGKQLGETKELNKQGFVEKIDLDRIQVLHNNLSTTRENAIRLLALGLELLKFQTGMSANDNLIIVDKIENINFDVNQTVKEDTTAYKRRIEYSLIETQGNLNRLDVKRLKSLYLPSLSAFGSSTYNYQADKFADLYDTKFPTSVVGLQLNVPIFSGFQRLNQIRQAKIAVLKSDNILHMVKNALQLQQESSGIMFQNGLQSLKNQKQNMGLAQEVLRVSRIKYEQGVGSSIEVTQAQTALEQAENNYIQALYNALISKVDLDHAYGRIQ